MVGDILELLEYDKLTKQLTDRKCTRLITYIVEGGQFGLDIDYVIMGIKPL